VLRARRHGGGAPDRDRGAGLGSGDCSRRQVRRPIKAGKVLARLDARAADRPPPSVPPRSGRAPPRRRPGDLQLQQQLFAQNFISRAARSHRIAIKSAQAEVAAQLAVPGVATSRLLCRQGALHRHVADVAVVLGDMACRPSARDLV
jgi:hypothetical protein